MDIATNTLIATATSVASATSQIPEVPAWYSYIVDIIFILLFLFVLFFIKPVKTEELTEEEKPNPLEQVLKTDSPEETETDDNAGNDVEQRD